MLHELHGQMPRGVCPQCDEIRKAADADQDLYLQGLADGQADLAAMTLLLGQVAAALCPDCARDSKLIKMDGKWFHTDARQRGISPCGLVIAGIDPHNPTVQTALAAWRKEQGQ